MRIPLEYCGEQLKDFSHAAATSVPLTLAHTTALGEIPLNQRSPVNGRRLRWQPHPSCAARGFSGDRRSHPLNVNVRRRPKVSQEHKYLLLFDLLCVLLLLVYRRPVEGRPRQAVHVKEALTAEEDLTLRVEWHTPIRQAPQQVCGRVCTSTWDGGSTRPPQCGVRVRLDSGARPRSQTPRRLAKSCMRSTPSTALEPCRSVRTQGNRKAWSLDCLDPY